MENGMKRIYRGGVPAMGLGPDRYRQQAAPRQTVLPVPLPEYGCDFPSLGMVYPNVQVFEQVYEPEKALRQGTAFAALDLPFAGGRCQ